MPARRYQTRNPRPRLKYFQKHLQRVCDDPISVWQEKRAPAFRLFKEAAHKLIALSPGETAYELQPNLQGKSENKSVVPSLIPLGPSPENFDTVAGGWGVSLAVNVNSRVTAAKGVVTEQELVNSQVLRENFVVRGDHKFDSPSEASMTRIAQNPDKVRNSTDVNHPPTPTPSNVGRKSSERSRSVEDQASKEQLVTVPPCELEEMGRKQVDAPESHGESDKLPEGITIAPAAVTPPNGGTHSLKAFHGNTEQVSVDHPATPARSNSQMRAVSGLSAVVGEALRLDMEKQLESKRLLLSSKRLAANEAEGQIELKRQRIKDLEKQHKADKKRVQAEASTWHSIVKERQRQLEVALRAVATSDTSYREKDRLLDLNYQEEVKRLEKEIEATNLEALMADILADEAKLEAMIEKHAMVQEQMTQSFLEHVARELQLWEKAADGNVIKGSIS